MQPTQPFFSIIIPTYARPVQLATCLQSLTQLDYPRTSFEVIVVDDGSEMPLDSVVSPLSLFPSFPVRATLATRVGMTSPLVYDLFYTVIAEPCRAACIAHRLSTKVLADKVVVLQQGQIIEQGGYQELLARRGKLWQYHQMQNNIISG